jgi:hypothetical protein
MFPQHPEPGTRTTNNESFHIIQFEALSLKGAIEQLADSNFITYYNRPSVGTQLQQHCFSRKHISFGVIQAVIL